MKRILSLSLAIIFMIFTACQKDGPITGPETPTAKAFEAEPKWIGFPPNADDPSHKSFFANAYVTVAEGGELTISNTYTSVDGATNHCFSDILFNPNTIQADCNITMSIDDATGTSTLLPHQMLDQPAILNQIFSGLDLSNVDVSAINLYYLAEDGTYEVMDRDDLIIDQAAGTITVINSKIPHFSVYGCGIKE